MSYLQIDKKIKIHTFLLIIQLQKEMKDIKSNKLKQILRSIFFDLTVSFLDLIDLQI